MLQRKYDPAESSKIIDCVKDITSKDHDDPWMDIYTIHIIRIVLTRTFVNTNVIFINTFYLSLIVLYVY